MMIGMKPGKLYAHAAAHDVIFQCVAVEEGKATGYWLTRRGTMLSTLSDRIPVKDFKGWAEIQLERIGD